VRALHPFEIARNAVALRVGTDLPRPRKLSVPAPGFALGACERLHFSPAGTHLIAVTANGTFLWDLATGTRGPKLAVPSNPTEIAFAVDGAQALARNEQGQFVRLSLPDGAVLAKFKAKHPWRLDGTPGLGPDDCVLQLAHGGALLELDGSNGKVRRQFPLEATGYSGEIHWFPRAGAWIVAQCSVDNGRGRGVPSALWRWDAGAPAPRRLPGQWDQLGTARAPGEDALLLHHVVAPGRPPRCALERFDLATGTATPIGETPGSIRPLPSLAHDGRAFGASTDDGPYLDIGGEVLRLPGLATYVQFHPTRDLVGISGRAAFVAPRAELARQLPELQVWNQERELGGRAYGRLSALAGAMPARLVVFARDHEWLVQAERIEGRHYAPLADAMRVRDDDPAAMGGAIAAMLARSRTGLGAIEPATPDERRPFHGGTVTPPGPGWSRGVAVAFAPDATDASPLKPAGAVGFTHENYPMAALAPDLDGAALVAALRTLLEWFKPRRG
jgi:hypothetical protein